MKRSIRHTGSRAAARCMLLMTLAALGPRLCHGQVMAVGVDRKFAYDEAVRTALPPGHDDVMFFDVRKPTAPKSIGSVALENSILGPPTNIAVAPDQSIALIANAVHSEKTETGWKAVAADEVFVVDLKATPPRLSQTLTVGRQPSGLAISRDGAFALVANRESRSVTMLRIDGTRVTVGDTLATNDAVGAIAIAPDGRRAVATKTLAHKALLIGIGADRKMSVEAELWTGLFPWNVAISPDGRLALVNNIGNNGQSDGGMKTVSVIDLAAATPYVADQLAVGDAPEGITFSPDGKFAAVTLLNGSYDAPSKAWFRHGAGSVALLRRVNDRVRLVDRIDVGAFPEGVAFSPDSRFIYAGNFASHSISILQIAAGHLADSGKTIALPGPPASLRIGSQ